MTQTFELHPRLAADCHLVGRWPEGLLLLHRNATVPWFILVPITGAEQLMALPTAQRQAVTERWNALATWIGSRFDCDRVNLGAIGNLVPQLHLHAVGRRRDDPAWPGVVWGFDMPEASWTETQRADLERELHEALALQD